MYRDHLMDHYKNPRQFGQLDNCTLSHTEKNPSCGDEITFDVILDEDIIKEVAFRGEGCAISIASASILAEELVGKTVNEILTLPRDEMLDMIGVPLTTMRVKCGLLGLHTVKKGLANNMGQEMQGEW